MKIIKLKLMQKYIIYCLYKIKMEGTMDHIKKVMTWAKANKQKSVIIVIVVIAIIALIK